MKKLNLVCWLLGHNRTRIGRATGQFRKGARESYYVELDRYFCRRCHGKFVAVKSDRARLVPENK